jgi:hypothetical protein
MAEDEVARISADRAKVAGVQLQLWALVIREDVMHLKIVSASAGDARRLFCEVLATHPRPST